jgi:hypothetical protein
MAEKLKYAGPVVTVGRSVHYVLPFGPNEGAVRPAEVVEVAQGEFGPVLDLCVTTNGIKDREPQAAFTDSLPRTHVNVYGVPWSPDGAPGTWNWPRRQD